MKRALEPDTNAMDEEDGEEAQVSQVTRKARLDSSQACPYLGTVNRERLDFDFEKVCSVSMQTNNIYACLVCGKYFQGRGRNSHANIHSLQAGHHVFLNLLTKKYYCLPDDYEIVNASLDDIKDVLEPQLSKQYVAGLDKAPVVSRTLEGLQHIAGINGLNNVKNNDYVNVTLQSLGHLSKLRDFFLLQENDHFYQKSELCKRFAVFLRKQWSHRPFRNHISPHEMLQEISNRSSNFKIGTRVNLVQFISWFLNSLHTDLTGGKASKSSIISDCFRGEVCVIAEKEEKIAVLEPEGKKKKRRAPVTPGEEDDEVKFEIRVTTTTKKQPFFFLTLDCPPPPLFKDNKDRNFIPQEPLYTLLSKFDGVTKQYVATEKEYRTFQITKLPQYLIFAINRFTSNFFITEKNRTIVTFPMKGLDMLPYTNLPPDTTQCTKYNLIANIRHNEGETAKEGYFNVHILQKSEDKWYDIQDMIIEEAMPPIIALSEAFIQIYERQDIF